MTKEEAEVIERALEFVDMQDGVRHINESSASLRLYKAVGKLRVARAKLSPGRAC